MTYYDLREMCDRYGLLVDFNITGQWEVGDKTSGSGYRLYVWEIKSSWLIRVLKIVGLEELLAMTYTDLERLVVECSLMAIAPEQ